MNELREVPVWLWIFVAIILSVQAVCLFRDAQKRDKGKAAWFWGIWGLTGAPSPTICYLLFVMLPDRKKRGGR
ncbi:hypothetical protein [Paenibacillus tengchongensis]|uniref:hypothetical protein n=1 Tax=Paenibacillus tengchongensis TaxID=2608684 RepID=UPI00124D82AF|nr:hypothetical protein [Paenibacillus tengchongensis]